MTLAYRKAAWVRAAGLAALLAWCWLVGHAVAHADDDHTNMSAHPCVVCSIGGPEDDIAPPPEEVKAPALEIPQKARQGFNPVIPSSSELRKTTARAPPRA